MSLNRATLIGNVGKDPDIRATQSGTKVANFSLATNEKWKDKQTGEAKEKTEWHRVVCWGDSLIGVIERYVKKGQQIMVEGKIQTREWTDEGGVKKYVTEIIVQGLDGRILLLGKSGTGGPPPNDTPPEETPRNTVERQYEDEIPF